VVPARVSRATHLWDLIRPLAEPVISGLFVLVLCMSMLGRRDDLRNRLIRLVGRGSEASTIRVLDEGAQRITRYLRDQTGINAIFGGVVGLGLYFIGIPCFVLWGAFAALARFVPYLGAIASMLVPAALAFALFPGWGRFLLTVGLFVGTDVVTAYAIEPVLIGYRTGVSSVGLLVPPSSVRGSGPGGTGARDPRHRVARGPGTHRPGPGLPGVASRGRSGSRHRFPRAACLTTAPPTVDGATAGGARRDALLARADAYGTT
jgi:hypothetical protein